MVALIMGLVVGTAIGAVGTVLLVVDPLRRERRVFRDRIIDEQMRTFAAEARLSAHLWPQTKNSLWSKNAAPPIRVVPEPPLPEVVKRPAFGEF